MAVRRSTGGIDYWNPQATIGQEFYQKITSGKISGNGFFVIISSSTPQAIDDIPGGTKIGTSIFFNKGTDRWSILSGSDSQSKFKGTFDDYNAIENNFPAVSQSVGDTAFNKLTATIWYISQAGGVNEWVDSLTNSDPNSLKSVANLSDLDNLVEARNNLSVYSKNQVDTSFQSNSQDDRNRANHTGTQSISTIDNLQTSLNDKLSKSSDTTDDITEGNAKFTTQSDIDKLAGIESGAEVNPTASETKGLYESNNNTNAFTDIEKSKLAGIQAGAEVNVNADWNSTSGDSEILNKPTLGTIASKNVGNQAGEIQENGSNLGNLEIVETNADGKFTTVSKNTAYNKDFGTGNSNVARGDASYLKNDADNLLNAKEDKSNKGVANGYASLDGNTKVPASQLNLTDYLNKTADTLDDVNEGATNKHFTSTLKSKLDGVVSGAEPNVQSDWNQTDNTQDDFIKNKPTFGDTSDKDVGNQVGEIQENGATLGNLEIVETDSSGKFITASKNTAYNKNFGTGSGQVAEGDASYLKNDTYTKSEANALLLNKEDAANKGQSGGYASLDSNAQVPLNQLPANAKSSKVVADITARDAIASADRFEGLRVHVLNATSDTTVSSGSAGYILKSGLANTDWEKTYESESIDVDLSDYFSKTTDTTDDITEGTAKFTTQGDIDKLAGIEANATADQTDSEIKTAYENNANTNAFTDTEKTNLSNQSGTNTGDETTASIQTKRPLKTIEGQSLEGAGNIDLTKSDVGLANVDNTSDADKPVSTAQQTALDAKLAKASNLTDVNNRQTSLNNLTDVGSAVNEYILTKDTTTGNAKWKPAPGGAGGTNLSIGTKTSATLDINSDTGNNATVPAASTTEAGLLTASDKTKLDATSGTNTGDEVAATESVEGVGKIITQAVAEAGTDDTNLFLNALKNKQAFDAFIAAHEAQKIVNTRVENNEISYGSNIDIETSTQIKSRGSITYANGIYTVGKDCTLLASCTLTFRNNGAPSNDNSFLHIYKSTDNGSTFTSIADIPIEPSNLIDSSMYLGQSFTDCAFDLNDGDKIKFRIVDVNLTQYLSSALVTFKEQ